MVAVTSEDSAASFRQIPAGTQLLAVAWLRWRLFANAFRRRAEKRHVIGLLFGILLRLIFYGMFGCMAMGMVFGAGFIAWNEAAAHREQNLALLLAGIFVGWQFISLNGFNIAASGPSFDPSSLARFPLPFGRYLILRTLFGLLTPSTIFGSLTLLAVAVGMTIANQTLAVPAFVVAVVYAWLNIFFTRMIAAWFERWLASRRFREIFGAVMVLVFVGIQLLNYSGDQSTSRKYLWFAALPHAAAPFLRWLPPGLAVRAMHVDTGAMAAAAELMLLLAWTALFMAIFALRIRKQFLGEYLSEAAIRRSPAIKAARPRRSTPATASPRACSNSGVFSPVVVACLRKEWLELSSSGGQLLAMAAPLLFVFVLGHGLFARHPRFFLPGAIAYVILGLIPKLYNIFGAEGCGVQIYLITPVQLRDIVLAKNIVSLIPIISEALLAWALVIILTRNGISPATQISAALWLLFVIAANLSVGTMRSIQEPHKFVPGQTRQTGTSTGRTSALLVIAMVVGSFLLYVPVELACAHFGRPWLTAFIFAALAVGALAGYNLFLRQVDQLLLRNRDRLTEELCRV